MEVVEQETGFGNIIVIDNLPVVAPEKFEKLQTVVKKIFGQIGDIREGGLYMPLDSETQKTKGFAFVEYNSPQVSEKWRVPGLWKGFAFVEYNTPQVSEKWRVPGLWRTRIKDDL